MSSVRDVVRSAATRLTDAGVSSPDSDAVLLAAFVQGVDPAEMRRQMVLGAVMEPGDRERLAELIAERAARVPLQHLTGQAHFRTLTLAVGPGVFVPRPETEVLVELALEALAGQQEPRVIDLCTGSGAIALSIAVEYPRGAVSAVELDPAAHAWAERNVETVRAEHGRSVDLRLGSAQEAFTELDGEVDLVVSNPPYIPEGMVPQDPEVHDHDPHIALYGGSDDGLRIPLEVIDRAAALLRPGGVVLMEHADTQGEALVATLADDERWTQVDDHLDLSGRPRVLRAVRA